MFGVVPIYPIGLNKGIVVTLENSLFYIPTRSLEVIEFHYCSRCSNSFHLVFENFYMISRKKLLEWLPVHRPYQKVLQENPEINQTSCCHLMASRKSKSLHLIIRCDVHLIIRCDVNFDLRPLVLANFLATLYFVPHTYMAKPSL